MRENIHVRIPQRPDHARGDLLARLTKRGVGRAEHQIELGEHLVRQIHAAVRVDFRFNPLQDPKILHAGIHLINLGPLEFRAFEIQPARNAQPFAVIGHRDIVQSARPRGLCHLLDSKAAIAPFRVRLQIALEVAEFDQVRQLAFLGGANLAGRFAQLGRNPLHPELFVDLFLTRGEDFLAGLEILEIPFAQRQTLVERDLAQLDAVLFAAREILQRGPPARRFEHP